MKLIIALAAMFFAVPALAQQQPKCGYTVVVETNLQTRYGEDVLDEQTRPMPKTPKAIVTWRVWVNQRTGSWTLTGTRGDVTCIFGGGLSGYDGKLVDDFLPPDVTGARL